MRGESELMDTFEFIASLVDSLAWPAGAVLTAIVLRGTSQQLISYLTKLKYGDLELSFEKDLKILEQRATAALPAGEGAGPPISISPEQAQLAETSPRAAIIDPWLRVSGAATVALKKRTGSVPASPPEIERALSTAHILGKEQLAVLVRLRKMQEDAGRGSPSSLDTVVALRYIGLASRLAARFEANSKSD